MDSIKNNKVLATIFYVALAGALGLGYLAYSAYAKYEASLVELEAMNGNLKRAESSALYPNQQNVEKLEGQVNDYSKEVSSLTKTLLHLQLPAEPIGVTEFQQSFKDMLAGTKATAEDSKVALPKDFALGFPRYASEPPKSPEAARQLFDYVKSVDAIVQGAIKSGVTSIDSLQRSELEVEKPDAPPPPPPSAAQLKRSKLKTSKKAAAPPAQVAQVTERRSVNLDITTDQAPLMALLNLLADANAMPYFTVVRILHVENEKQEGPLKSIQAPSATASEEESKTAPAAAANPDDPNAPPPAPVVETIEAPKPASPDALAIMGHEKLKVHLEIDVVRFQDGNSAPAAN
jgi:hypothetical protein